MTSDVQISIQLLAFILYVHDIIPLFVSWSYLSPNFQEAAAIP